MSGSHTCSLTLQEGIVLALEEAWEFTALQDGLGLHQTIDLNLAILTFHFIVDCEVIATWSGIRNLVQGCLKLILLCESAIHVVLAFVM